MTRNPDNSYNTAFVLPAGLGLGGVTTWTINMCRHLASLKRHVMLIEHTHDCKELDAEIPQDVEVFRCAGQVHPNSPRIMESDLDSYLPHYLSVLPSIVIPNWSPGTYAACASVASRSPESIRVIGIAHTDEADYYKWLVYYEPIIHLFIAVSREIAVTLEKFLPHRTQDIIVCSCPVDAPSSSNRKYSTPDAPLIMTYAGNLVERQKRISDLIDLAGILTTEGMDFRLQIIGDGPDKKRFCRNVNSLDSPIRRKIVVRDSVSPDEMPSVWRSSDISILVSEYEGSSIAMRESMAHGCVPVVTRVSGVADVVNQGVNGFWVPVGDMRGMAGIIKSLDDDRNKLNQLGARAHATMHKQLSYDAYVKWFGQALDLTWNQPPRVWPADRPLLPPDLTKIHLQEVLSAVGGCRNALENVLAKLTSKRYLRWLYNYLLLARKHLRLDEL